VDWYLSAETLDEALATQLQARVDLRAGNNPYDRYTKVDKHQPADERMTVNQWIDHWIIGRRGARTSQTRDHYLLKNHIRPTFGDMVAGEVTKLQVKRWVGRICDDVGIPTARNAYQLLHQIMADAEDDPKVSGVTVTPCRRIAFPEYEPAEKEWLTVAETVAVVAEMREVSRRNADLPKPPRSKDLDRRRASTAERDPGWYSVLILFLAWTGCRWSEAAGMRRADINLLKRQAMVNEPWTRALGGGAHGKPKTLGSKRVIDLPVFLCEMLSVHLQHPHDYVFPNRKGGPAYYDEVFRSLPAFTERMFGKHITPHCFRHGHRTWLEEVEPRPSEVAINKRLGHKTRGSKGRYTHVTLAMRKQITTALGDLWKEANRQVSTGATGDN
jgi:integrase